MIRPLKHKVKTILKVAISLAVVAFVLFLWASARPVPIQVRVTFTGFANPALPTQASFCVSNAGRCSVIDEGVQRIEIKYPQLGGVLCWAGRSELKPGEIKTITLFPELRREPWMRLDNRGNPASALETNLDPWRLSLPFYKGDWREKLVQNPPRVLRNPPSVLRKVLQFVPAKWLERHTIEVHSEWINGAAGIYASPHEHD